VTSRNSKILEQFRADALARDIPSSDVERWTDLVRPCALLTESDDGPVVGRFGGPVSLPAGAPDPQYPLIATIDLAALPAGVTDLPLPSGGTLLLFGFPEEDGMGEVMYVPAGAAVEERAQYPEWFPPDEDEYAGVYAELPRGDLHLTADVSLPYVGYVELPRPPWTEPLPGHPHSEALASVWEDQWGGAPLLIGGYGTDYNGGDACRAAATSAALASRAGHRPGETSDKAEDWVLLAEAQVDRPGAGAGIFWAIERDDLVAQRFDRAYTVVDWNP
jgi:hypothetical protein